MKKIFIAGILSITSLSINAQSKFESNVKVRFDAGIDAYKNNSFGAEYIGGYRINPNIKIGAGTGVYWVNQLYDQKGLYSDYKEDAVSIPLFVNGKFNFYDGGVSPFFNMNVGYSLFVPCSEYAKCNHLSAFFNPSFGIDIPLTKGAMTIEIGYKYQMRNVDENAITVGGTYNYSQFEACVGFQF